MANQEHLQLLRQGVQAWNTWKRQQTRKFIVDLCDADLADLDLSSADLWRANLSSTNLSNTNLTNADLRAANLTNADLRGTHFRRAQLVAADLRQAKFTGADLTGADLAITKLTDTNLTGADFEDAYLHEADLRGANFTEVILRRAIFTEARCDGANLNRAILNSANLSGANLNRATLNSANLGGANFSGANLSGADVTNATVGWTTFANLDLRTIKGLETLRHDGPSTIGIDTLYHSEGQIPESFLRKAGVPEDFLAYLPGLVNKAIEYYTCFISYTKEDEDFAKRLYADLQANGVRCWFAPEHLKIGDKYQDRIFESIRLYDKLLLLLSEASVTSDWVQAEVEAALSKEVQKKREVLFPVRLDDAVMQSTSGWADSIRQTRHIGDFTRWKDHDAYRQAFKQLLRDLQSKRPQPQRKRESR